MLEDIKVGDVVTLVNDNGDQSTFTVYDVDSDIKFLSSKYNFFFVRDGWRVDNIDRMPTPLPDEPKNFGALIGVIWEYSDNIIPYVRAQDMWFDDGISGYDWADFKDAYSVTVLSEGYVSH